MEPIQYPYNKEKEDLKNRIKILEKKLLNQNEFKEQIISAYNDGKYLSDNDLDAETYYKNKYETN